MKAPGNARGFKPDHPVAPRRWPHQARFVQAGGKIGGDHTKQAQNGRAMARQIQFIDGLQLVKSGFLGFRLGQQFLQAEREVEALDR